MAEKKYKDAATNGTANTTGTIIASPLVGQGVGDGFRVGDEIQRRSWTINTTITAGDNTNIVRIICFAWNFSATLSVPTWSGVIENVAFPIESPLNREAIQKKWMTPIWDKRIAMTIGGRQTINITKKMYGKMLPRKRVQFTTGTSDTSNTYYIAFVSDSVAVPNPAYTLYQRLTYTDV